MFFIVSPYVYGWLKVILMIVGAGAVGLGVICVANPKWVIDRQMTLYRSINWKVEPISWKKEIRNTRIMGVTALLCGILTLLVLAWR